MALVSRPVDVPVPCPSPARVGSTGTMQYLLQKERPTDHPTYGSRGGTGGAKSSKEFVHVCREVVSVSCGQPLLSYKPKRSKSSKIAKAPDSSSKPVAASKTPDSSVRLVSNRVLGNASRLAGCSEVASVADSKREAAQPRATSRVKEVWDSAVRRSSVQADDHDTERERPSGDHEEYKSRESPIFQKSACTMIQKPLPDADYHKALIPFLRAEWDASSKVVNRRQCSQAPRRSGHRRSTSLGNTSSAPNSDQKAWQSYTRDSYPPFSATKKYSFFRLSSSPDNA